MGIPEEKYDASCAMPIKPVHFPWREGEVKEMFQQHDRQSIARLHRLGFLRLTGQPQGKLTSECWDFHPADILNNKGYSAARVLSGQNMLLVHFTLVAPKTTGVGEPSVHKATRFVALVRSVVFVHMPAVVLPY